jgi:hypothetical protein
MDSRQTAVPANTGQGRGAKPKTSAKAGSSGKNTGSGTGVKAPPKKGKATPGQAAKTPISSKKGSTTTGTQPAAGIPTKREESPFPSSSNEPAPEAKQASTETRTAVSAERKKVQEKIRRAANGSTWAPVLRVARLTPEDVMNRFWAIPDDDFDRIYHDPSVKSLPPIIRFGIVDPREFGDDGSWDESDTTEIQRIIHTCFGKQAGNGILPIISTPVEWFRESTGSDAIHWPAAGVLKTGPYFIERFRTLLPLKSNFSAGNDPAAPLPYVSFTPIWKGKAVQYKLDMRVDTQAGRWKYHGWCFAPHSGKTSILFYTSKEECGWGAPLWAECVPPKAKGPGKETKAKAPAPPLKATYASQVAKKTDPSSQMRRAGNFTAQATDADAEARRNRERDRHGSGDITADGAGPSSGKTTVKRVYAQIPPPAKFD